MPRLLFAISAHGLGHLGQAAPVCNALLALRPDLKLTVWSALPVGALRHRIHHPFMHVDQSCDIGFTMHDALHVDVAASWRHYRQRENDWAAHLENACAVVRAAHPDLIISDVGEMPLAAGQSLGIPTIAMSSLNWADMARTYFADMPGSTDVLNRLSDIYDNSTLALRLSPGMPMRGRAEQILPPVGAVSHLTRQAFDQALHTTLPYPDQPRVLIGLGGIETALPLCDWPKQQALNLLVVNQNALPEESDALRGIVNADTLRARYGWNFCDLLAACDVAICKPGYGTFVEAALIGIPALYVKRPDWPEQPVLVNWLQAHARCAELALSDLHHGNFAKTIAQVMAQPSRPPLPRDGATIAARAILSLLP